MRLDHKWGDEGLGARVRKLSVTGSQTKGLGFACVIIIKLEDHFVYSDDEVDESHD